MTLDLIKKAADSLPANAAVGVGFIVYGPGQREGLVTRYSDIKIIEASFIGGIKCARTVTI